MLFVLLILLEYSPVYCFSVKSNGKVKFNQIFWTSKSCTNILILTGGSPQGEPPLWGPATKPLEAFPVLACSHAQKAHSWHASRIAS